MKSSDDSNSCMILPLQNISHIAPMNTNTIAGSTIIFCRFSRCASVSGSRSFFGFPVSGAALFSFVGSFFVCSI